MKQFTETSFNFKESPETYKSSLASNFSSDLEKEQKLSLLIDTYYQKYLKHYTFERIYDIKRQHKGIDVILKHKTSGKPFYLDEKAQLDYINETLPTFAFELNYEKKGVLKEGWLFDIHKETQFYALITSIYSDAPNEFTSCKITLVNREKLLAFLAVRNINRNTLKDSINRANNSTGKIKIHQLNHRTEGYLFLSKNNKAEKPTNLIFRLNFLIEHKIAKPFI